MENNSNYELKLAIDVGTTSVELAIIDNKGEIIASCYFKNPQSLYGKDVMTRINTSIRNKSFLTIMKDLLVDSLSNHIISLISDYNLKSSDIVKIMISGNTTMISILLQYDLDELGFYPFKHKLRKSVIVDSYDIFNKDLSLQCPVILTGCSSAFIGGDVLSGLFYIENEYNISKNDKYLFLDLGTNGEMIIYNGDKYYSASCACGPAFEASIRCDNIYGNTLIDAIALGIKSGKISQYGILDDLYLENGLNLLGTNITADVLREIILAKAAIKTGIEILLRESNTDFSSINKVYIAGGFGIHLNIDNATFIGLIPKYLKDKIQMVGNTSLKGSIYALNYNQNTYAADYYIDKGIQLIHMTSLPDYQDLLINNMNFI